MALLKSGTRIYGNATIDTNLSIDGNTVSSNYQSGALVVAGGVGIGGNVFINGKLNAKDTLITGNLTVTGVTTTVNSTTTQIEDAVIDLGAGENGNTLTTDDGVSRGLALNYFSSGAKTAFLGWDNANSQFAFGSNVANTTGVLQINTYGNVKANTFFGTFSGIGNLSQLTVSGVTRLGNVGNVKITGGGLGQYLQTDGQGNLTWVSPQTTSPGGSNNQVQFNSNGSFAGSSSFTFDSSNNILTVGYIVANGSSLTSITGANVTGTVANANYSIYAVNAGNAYNVSGSNVTGQVSNALVAGTVYTNAQPNITSVGTLGNLSVTGNITSGNINGGNLVVANYFVGNGSLLTSVTGANVTGTVANANYATYAGNATVAGTVYANYQPNITGVGNLSNLFVGNTTSNVVIANGNVTATGNLSVTGNLSAGYITGNAAYLTGLAGSGSATATYVTSNISTVVAGSTITVVADYGNASYPGGVFTIAQLGPVTLSTTDIWYGGTSTKNAYANYLASSVNTKNVNVTLTLSNATFNVQSTDSITIGGSSITGANLLALNINGNGTYTIPNTYFSSSVQTTTTSSVSLSLTTSRGVYTSTGTTLTATQPVAFTLNAITGSFPSSSVPYFDLNQSFNWSTSITGTVSSGNLTYSGGLISTTSLTSSGATSGSSSSIDSTYSYTLTTSDYTGAGLYGYGTRVIPSTVNGTISAATKYYPVFYKITSSATPPTFTTSDSYLTHNYVTGDGATTSSTTSQYTWIAIPGVASHTFAYTFLGSQVGQDPAVTATQSISGYSYNIYGFTNFSVATFLYTVT